MRSNLLNRVKNLEDKVQVGKEEYLAFINVLEINKDQVPGVRKQLNDGVPQKTALKDYTKKLIRIMYSTPKDSQIFVRNKDESLNDFLHRVAEITGYDVKSEYYNR